MYFVNLFAQAQASTNTQDVQTLLKHVATNVEVENIRLLTLPLAPNAELGLSFEGMTYLSFLAVRATKPISVSLLTQSVAASILVDMPVLPPPGDPVPDPVPTQPQLFSTNLEVKNWAPPARLHLWVFDNLQPQHLRLKGAATQADVEISFAGRLTLPPLP